MTRALTIQHIHSDSAARPLLRMLYLCVLEARPCVLGICSLRYAAGVALGASTVAAGRPAAAVATGLVCVLATFVVYLFNGVMDVREDTVNGSSRPIASGELSRPAAAHVAGGVAALALGCAVVLGDPAVWTVPAALVLGYLYSGPPCHLKRRPIGTTLVVTLAGLLTYYTGFSAYAGHAVRPGAALLTLAIVMSLWMGFVGAPTKDLSDIVGDAAAGRCTGAVRGESHVRRFSSAAALGLAVAFLAVSARVAPALTVSAIVMLAGAAAVAVLNLSPLSLGSRSRRRRPYRAFMLTQYVVHVTVVLVAPT